MSLTAWPFLVSRNRTVGYTIIVAPQFLRDKNLLAEVAGGALDEPDTVIYREIHGLDGKLTLVFRVIQAEQQYIGLTKEEPLEPLTDRSGRVIYMTEGFIIKNAIHDITVMYQDIQISHERVVQVYKEFWNETSSLFSVESVPPFHLQADDEIISEPLTLYQQSPFTFNQKLFLSTYEDARDGSNQAVKPLPYNDIQVTKPRDIQVLKPAPPNDTQVAQPLPHNIPLKPPYKTTGKRLNNNLSSKRLKLLMGAGVTGLLLILGGGIFNKAQATFQAQHQILTTFCTALQESPPDYQQAYNQLQQSESETTFAHFFTQRLVNSCSFNLAFQLIQPTTATLTLKYVYQNQVKNDTINLTLTQDNQGIWKIKTNIIQELP